MKFYIDISTRQFVRGPASGPLSTTFFKRRDSVDIEVVFVDRAAIVPAPLGTSILAGIKGHFGGDFLALSDSSGTLNLHTTAVEALFSSEPEKVPALFEVKTSRPGEETRTHTLGIEIQNAVILGDEGLPVDSPSLKASASDAQAGLDNTKWMTPLRTAEAIAALAPTGGGGGSTVTWSTLTGKPATFPPSTHTHAYADITGKPTTFAPAAHTHPSSQVTGLAAVATSGDFADLTNKPTSLPPAAHGHTISEVTGLSAALDGKQPAGNYAAATHTHSAADITSGTIDPARLPVLPSSVQVVSSGMIPSLTQAEQNQITSGAVVTTSDGGRWIYRSGSKTNTDSYVKLADLTPDWSVIANKPAVFQPATHSHAIADVTGLDSALAGKQPAGSYATAAQGALADTASQPGHTHSTSQIAGLDPSLAAKISGTGVTSLEVVQSLPATLVPTTFYILIPSGATAATSVQLGSIPLFTGSGGGGGGGGTSGSGPYTSFGFTVSSVGSMELWLDANTSLYNAVTDGSLVTSGGTRVARWEDMSGNNRHATQANVNYRPMLNTNVLNGKNSILFDGVNDTLALPDALAPFFTGEYTIIAVAKTDAGATDNNTNSIQAIFGRNGYYQGLLFTGYPNTTHLAGAIWSSNLGTSVYSGIEYTQGSWTIGVDRVKSLVGNVWSTQAFNNTLSSTPATLTSNSLGSPQRFPMVNIGCNGNADTGPYFNYFLNGYISEILFYSRGLTDQELTTIRTYLNQKYAVY